MPSSPRRPSRSGGTESILAQFSSGQIVIGLCFLIFVCCVAFLLGMLAERYEGRRSGTAAAGIAAPAPPAPGASREHSESPAAETAEPGETSATGARRSLLDRVRAGQTPRETTLPPERATSSRVMPPLPAPGTERAPRREPDPSPEVRTQDSPAPARPAAAAEEAPAEEQPAEPPAEAAREQHAARAETTDPATEAPILRPPQEPAAATAPEPAPKPAPKEEKPAAEAPVLQPSRPAPASSGIQLPPRNADVGLGAFGVQVASFQGANREQQAREFQRIARDRHQLATEILPSSDGQYHRVVVTGYNDRATANRAAEALKQHAQFKDCFVRPLP